jgi:hypothetical protein
MTGAPCGSQNLPGYASLDGHLEPGPNPGVDVWRLRVRAPRSTRPLGGSSGGFLGSERASATHAEVTTRCGDPSTPARNGTSTTTTPATAASASATPPATSATEPTRPTDVAQPTLSSSGPTAGHNAGATTRPSAPSTTTADATPRYTSATANGSGSTQAGPDRENPPVRDGHWRVQWAWLLLLALLLPGCGSSAVGDPGGRRLEQLSNDGVFAGVPMSSTMVRVQRTPAKHREPGFDGGGWTGPSVVVSFRSAKPSRVVFQYFARRAVANGWHPTAKGSLGLTDRWAKSYADGAAATLVLSQLGHPDTPERMYMLQGGIAPVAR